MGVVNILISANYHISLGALAKEAMDLLGITDEDRQSKLLGEIQDFFRLRVKNVLSDDGMRYDLIDAVLALGVDDIYDTWLKAKALAVEGASEAMQTAVQALTRVGNLAKKRRRIER